MIVIIVKKRRGEKKSTPQVEMSDVKVARSPSPSSMISRDSALDIPLLSGIKVGRRLGGGNFGDVYLGDWRG